MIFIFVVFTAAPDIPGPITKVNLSSTSVTLSWEHPHRGILDGFVVETDPSDGVVREMENLESKWRQIDQLIPGIIVFATALLQRKCEQSR